MSESPTFMHTFGPAGDPIATLGWTLTWISVATVLIVTALLMAGLMRRRKGGGLPGDVERSKGGSNWIYIGTGVSTIVLVASFIYTMRVLADTTSPPRAPSVTVRIVGHQWWWQVGYSDRAGQNAFVTANEIHVPVGHPVRFELTTQDVIHSFWVPQLAGKTDLIPGRTTIAWMQASAPGKYLGMCGEYCGLQHAHMQLTVIAEDPAAFRAWWGRQLESRTAPATPAEADGERVFLSRCSACHTVRGSGGAGLIGPDLTHIMSRVTLAAGTIPDSRGFLAGWITNPQQIKPGTKMPTIPLSSSELQSLLGYLETLK